MRPTPTARLLTFATAAVAALAVGGCATPREPTSPRDPSRSTTSIGAEPRDDQPGGGFGADDVMRRGPGGMGGGR